jgi:hypothetical protein
MDHSCHHPSIILRADLVLCALHRTAYAVFFHPSRMGVTVCSHDGTEPRSLARSGGAVAAPWSSVFDRSIDRSVRGWHCCRGDPIEPATHGHHDALYIPLHIPEPLSMTRAAISSSSAMVAREKVQTKRGGSTSTLDYENQLWIFLREFSLARPKVPMEMTLARSFVAKTRTLTGLQRQHINRLMSRRHGAPCIRARVDENLQRIEVGLARPVSVMRVVKSAHLSNTCTRNGTTSESGPIEKGRQLSFCTYDNS